MKKLAISVATVLAAAMAMPAAANAEWYAGVGYTQFSAEDVDVGAATGRLGYKFHPNFGVEGEASFGIDEDTADNLGTPVDVELEDQYGVYAVGFLPLSENFDLIGRVGYVTVDAAASVGGFTAGVDDEGVGYGAGAQWRFSPNFALRADYTRLEGEEDGVDAYGVSGVWSF